MSKIRSTSVTRAAVTLFDAALAFICMYGVVTARYFFAEEPVPQNIALIAASIFALSCLLIWVTTQLSKAVWRYTSLDDLWPLLQGVILISLITPLVLFVGFDRAENFPRSVPFFAAIALFIALTISRVIVMIYYKRDIRSLLSAEKTVLNKAILIGRSDHLHDYIRDNFRGPAGPYSLVGLIDTSGEFSGRAIRGVPVLGDISDIPQALKNASSRGGKTPTLIMVDDKLGKGRLNALVKIAAFQGATLVRAGRGQKDKLTPLEAADLIGRDAKTLDTTPVRQFIQNRRVLITGAGGTIGSELTAQVAALAPEHLALVDQSEYNLYKIDRELSESNQCLFTSYLGDICDEDRMREIFARERPDIVFHAAALKHVPLSEANPIEAVATNVAGTDIIIKMATEFGTDSFTLVSTDKAVKPSNIMGATKRIAEMLTLAAATQSPTLSACAVRFGNVLASAGSVVPLFEEQIARGGPVTVTHKDATRYFMTTDEAAALVLQASALSAVQRKEMAAIYVLDMGEPVNIAHLARQLIRLRGYVPDRDIDIEYSGLRTGEKLTEILTDDRENLSSTYVEGVMRFTGTLVDPKSVGRRVERLIEATKKRDKAAMTIALQKVLPDYEPNGTLKD